VSRSRRAAPLRIARRTTVVPRAGSQAGVSRDGLTRASPNVLRTGAHALMLRLGLLEAGVTMRSTCTSIPSMIIYHNLERRGGDTYQESGRDKRITEFALSHLAVFSTRAA
jgi:hypothetical protein